MRLQCPSTYLTLFHELCRVLLVQSTKLQLLYENSIIHSFSSRSPNKCLGLQFKMPVNRYAIQIIVGTYDKLLHGTIATVQNLSDIEFFDNFLFEAHTSAVRCIALSPPSPSSNVPQQQRIILASGGSDEKINLYHISLAPPACEDGISSPLASLASKTTWQNPSNRELGSLIHHSSGINALYFSSRSKLISAADDNTIAITRTRDWTVLSSIKAPIPKAHGRPSGDTAPLGGTPTGVNDFAVHPSMKLMVSVGKGEKCIRLWNLVTGKRAGVLNFEKSLLQGIEKGKWGSGEGRRIMWNAAGTEFLVVFEKSAVLFGLVIPSLIASHVKG